MRGRASTRSPPRWTRCSRRSQLEGQSFDAVPALPGLPAALDAARAAAQALRTTADAKVNGVGLPDGSRQSPVAGRQPDPGPWPTAWARARKAADAGRKAPYDALDAVVGHPDQLDELFADAATLKPRLQAISAAAQPLSDTVGSARLLEGAPRQVAQTALRAVQLAVDARLASAELLELLTGDELTLRFDWNPVIRNWSIKAGDPPLFVANDPHGFRVAVEARVRKNGQSAPKLSVTCSLKSFDLVLIAPASFLELNFEKIEFRIDTAAKMDVDVLLTDIKFVGPLSFVETLRDLIPLGRFLRPALTWTFRPRAWTRVSTSRCLPSRSGCSTCPT